MKKADRDREARRLEKGMNARETQWFRSLLYEFPDADPADVADMAVTRAAPKITRNPSARHAIGV